MTPEDVKEFTKMGDLDQSFVVDVIEVLQLPGDMEGDMDGPGTYG
jgi:hypothetical protein